MKCNEVIIAGKIRYACPACKKSFQSIRSCVTHVRFCKAAIGMRRREALLEKLEDK